MADAVSLRTLVAKTLMCSQRVRVLPTVRPELANTPNVFAPHCPAFAWHRLHSVISSRNKRILNNIAPRGIARDIRNTILCRKDERGEVTQAIGGERECFSQRRLKALLSGAYGAAAPEAQASEWRLNERAVARKTFPLDSRSPAPGVAVGITRTFLWLTLWWLSRISCTGCAGVCGRSWPRARPWTDCGRVVPGGPRGTSFQTPRRSVAWRP